MDLIGLLIQIVVGTIVIAPVLWLAGRALAGKDKAKFTDAIWIVLLGTVIGVIVGAATEAIVDTATTRVLIAAILMFIVWLGLISHFFDCGWIKALAIAIVAVIIFIVIGIVLAAIGIAVLTFLL